MAGVAAAVDVDVLGAAADDAVVQLTEQLVATVAPHDRARAAVVVAVVIVVVVRRLLALCFIDIDVDLLNAISVNVQSAIAVGDVVLAIERTLGGMIDVVVVGGRAVGFGGGGMDVHGHLLVGDKSVTAEHLHHQGGQDDDD